MNSSHIRTGLLIILAGILGYFVGTNHIQASWQNYNPQITVTSKEPPSGISNVDMTMFWVVLEKLETDYYDQSVVKPQDMVNGAIEGMVSSLNDPFTVFLPPTSNTAFQQQISGQFGGIGAELGMQNNQVIVIAPLDGSPAQKAGIKAGDVILKVDKNIVAGIDLNEVVSEIKGPKGTPVKLTVLHKGASTSTVITIIRDTINVKSVFSWVKEVKDIDGINQTSLLKQHATDKVAYIRLSEFGEQSDQEWSKIVTNIASQMAKDKSVKGVVLDLRDNPGGLLTDAVYIGSEFISKGVIVQQEDGKGNITQLSVNRKGLLTNVPLVVLIDGGSASASEIVSGALRDHQRAKLVGEQSFGKGTVQEALDLGNGAGLHVTIAKWLTPNGTWVHQKGLTPDVIVHLDPKDPSRDTQLEQGIETLLQ